MQDKLVSFNRNEIYFNDRKSVMLILRDISDIQNLNKKIKANEKLQLAYQSISTDFQTPFESIEQVMATLDKSHEPSTESCQLIRN